jgi:hypothetical protein
MFSESPSPLRCWIRDRASRTKYWSISANFSIPRGTTVQVLRLSIYRENVKNHGGETKVDTGSDESSFLAVLLLPL